MINQYKLLFHFTIWNLIFAILCIPTAGKLVDIMGVPLSISIFYFPFVYIISDIVTEVYGYAAARRVLWYTIIAQVAAVLVFQFVVYYPPSAVFTDNEAFTLVLKAAPKLVLFGTLAVFLGDIANNFVLSKMKLWFEGKYMSGRFVVSTLIGQLVNTAVFYCFGLWGILPLENMFESILIASLAKILVELVMLPLTIFLTKKVKKIEHVDVYDKDTNYNPLKF